MKRIIFILLVSLMLLAVLISCNEAKNDTSTDSKSIDTPQAKTEIISGADAIQIALAHFYGAYNAKPSLGDYYSASLLTDSETESSHFVMIYEKCYDPDNLIDGGCTTYEISKSNGDILSIIAGE